MVEVRVKVLADRDKDESGLTAAQSVDMKKG